MSLNELYETSERCRMFMEMVDDDGNEIPDEVICDTFEALEGELNDKVDDVVHTIMKLKSSSALKRKRAAELNERARMEERRAERLKELLMEWLDSLGKTKIRTDFLRVTIRSNPGSLLVTQPDAFIQWAEKNAGELLRYSTPEINRTATKEFLRTGGKAPGVEVTTTRSLIYK